MKRKMPIIILISLVLIFVSFPWVFMYLHMQFSPDPPLPEITYGEFPFRLEYEVNGERFVVEDTVICEYDGIGMNEAQGKYRKWKSYLASNKKEDSVLLLTDEERKIYCFVGSAEYYMNDETYPEQRPLSPRVYAIRLTENSPMPNQEGLLDMYNVKLISWNLEEPITNSFK